MGGLPEREIRSQADAWAVVECRAERSQAARRLVRSQEQRWRELLKQVYFQYHVR